jgi:hypothetical protein
MDHFVKALAVHRTERSGVIKQGCDRTATFFQPCSRRVPAAGRL